ncbi:MAG TPA: FAD-dependent oxidoreductase [Lacibacter sp.]|nr:FAD-dependent oxidoreductase [Lacibacter sp.]HMO87936.1 FAD-dependent oxidoreductase [Lacibacter sp.]HMP86253.1 FAD-dependent oxidoreductase [Lacibacter sp.]
MYDCIVVGGGLAGLTAARQLRLAGKKLLLLEAKTHTGGRVITERYQEDTKLDLGAQWIGPGQDRIYQLCREMDVRLIPSYHTGRSSLYLNKKLRHYKGLIPPLPLLSLWQLHRGLKRINARARQVPLEQPWAAPEAFAWDTQTAGEWIRANLPNEKARTLFQLAFEAIFAAHPDEVSLLHSLFYIHSGGGMESLMEMRGGAQQDRFLHGAGRLSESLQLMLYDDLRIRSAVTGIAQDADGVTVNGAGFTFKARKLIVAVPPPVVNKIHFEQPLPARRVQLQQEQFMGSVMKCFAVYNEPFWRKKRLNGMCALPGETVSLIFDCSPPNACKGVLVGFVLASRARELLELYPRQRQQLVLECFSRFAGPAALDCEYYTDKSFETEPWALGCYAGLMPPGTLTATGEALRTPCGHIHWAGTETSPVWNGYMEGAVRSGERAVREVLALL